MKIEVDEIECYPVLTIKPVDPEYQKRWVDIIEVDEETYQRWVQAREAFWDVQREIGGRVREQERKTEEQRYWTKYFARENPSRSDKAHVLSHFGWVQVDTSVWEKDGVKYRLHEAFNLCKKNYEDSND